MPIFNDVQLKSNTPTMLSLDLLIGRKALKEALAINKLNLTQLD